MRLILSGGGAGEQVKESYKLFANSVKGQKIMYIPFAWEDDNYAGCLEWLSNDLKPYGINNIDMVTSPEQITSERLNKVKGVFIGGGNTFKLLKLVKESCAYDNLKEFALKEGSVIMGGSAGALVWGKSIETCKDDGLNIKSICDINFVGLKDTTGFNMIKGYSLLVHYKKKEEQIHLTEQRIKRLLNEGHKLVCLPEEASLVVENDKIYVIGAEIEIITKLKRENFKPKQTIDLQHNLV